MTSPAVMDQGVVDGYEQLRPALGRDGRRVAAGAGGVAAPRSRRLAGLRDATVPGPPPTPPGGAARDRRGVDTELVGLLASMALAVAAGGERV